MYFRTPAGLPRTLELEGNPATTQYPSQMRKTNNLDLKLMCAVLFAGQTETSLPGAGSLLTAPFSLLFFLQAEHGQLNLFILEQVPRESTLAFSQLQIKRSP